MKAENFDTVKVLMEERERLERIKERVERSDQITFSSQSHGSQHFVMPFTHKGFNEFKASVVLIYTEKIEEVDEKLKDL